jgi:hypothetical protein
VLESPIETGFGLRRVKPKLIIRNYLGRLDHPNPMLDLFHHNSAAGVLFSERDLAAGADSFHFHWHNCIMA